MNVLIIGASGELGSVVAKKLAIKGHSLILHGHKNINSLNNLADELNCETILLADLTNEEEVKELIEKSNRILKLDGIVYASGINPTTEKISDTSLDTWNKTLQINLTGAFLALKYAIPLLRENPQSSIVIISSIFGISAPTNRGAYSASKHGLSGLVQCASKEEAGNIRINAVCPGPMWSENVRNIFAKHAKSIGISVEDYIKNRQRQIPYGRFLEMEECASLVLYLLSNESSFITGELIRISGGEF